MPLQNNHPKSTFCRYIFLWALFSGIILTLFIKSNNYISNVVDRDLVKTQCKVTDYEINKYYDDELYPTYTLHNGFINFEYRVVASNRYFFGKMMVANDIFEREDVNNFLERQYPIGKSIDCYYKQNNPIKIQLHDKNIMIQYYYNISFLFFIVNSLIIFLIICTGQPVER